MMVTDEWDEALVQQENDFVRREPNYGVLDNGDAAVLVGATTLEKYVVHLLGKGIDVRDLKVYPCTEHFRFGDDNTGSCNYCALIPVTTVTCGTRCGTILAYVIRGETPFQIGRPIMENLGLAIDFASSA